MPAKPEYSLALVPRYSVLRACGVILQILGLSLAVGVLMLLSAAAYWAGPPTHGMPGDLTSGLMKQLKYNQYTAKGVYGATLLLGGLVYLGMGLLVSLAIDVAQNSYKQTLYLSRLLDRANPPERTPRSTACGA
jgi:hypothetical protein